MKKRSSIEKAEWTGSREDLYKKECFKMTFDYGDELVVDNDSVYISRGNERIIISKPIKEKSFWFEAWTAMKSFYKI